MVEGFFVVVEEVGVSWGSCTEFYRVSGTWPRVCLCVGPSFTEFYRVSGTRSRATCDEFESKKLGGRKREKKMEKRQKQKRNENETKRRKSLEHRWKTR